MGFTVHITPSGKQFEVEDDETVLDAAARQHINLPYNCRDGLCGSCKAVLKSGEVDYGEELPPALSDEEREAGIALLCQAHAKSDLEIEAQIIEGIADIPVRKLPCRVLEHKLLCHDVMELKLKAPDNMPFRFIPGQYINILLKDGRHRSFSIANTPNDENIIELHVRHVEGGEFSEYVFAKLQDKTLLRFEGPLGTFFLREDSERPMILMAGGTGFAPIKGIVEHALEIGITRPMYIYWGARSQQDLYLHELPQQWAAEHEHVHYIPVLSDPLPEDNWQGRTGFVHAAIVGDFEDLSGYDVYAGGPPQMVNAGFEAFSELGLPPEQYFSDSFEYAKK
ncbi:MAG: CDP-6-deoxy-delta-3,4-glucoseen reductase [Granulosicoccaceae bacterium]|jgi:CDP-4-dehydro-6-deoxyglucose reductase